MIETEKGKRIEQILATDVTREQLAEALWCAESSQRMWHGCAEENRNFRLKAESENVRLRELLGDALKTLFYKRFDGSVGCTENCPRWQFSKDCQLVDGCWLELEAAKLGIEVD